MARDHVTTIIKNDKAGIAKAENLTVDKKAKAETKVLDPENEKNILQANTLPVTPAVVKTPAKAEGSPEKAKEKAKEPEDKVETPKVTPVQPK